ncbi:hypothetical protein L3Q82_016566 [Scortum barcoo]|uniref:Uncharacterized protein n=1 Tax=Scortum barcoo TaxID=214431 RepID=A0ACB8X8I0_9TELE|nr:hypothetical protein L3Q82_016566 [Scortum barcoo]
MLDLMWLECVQQFLQDEGIDAMDWPARSPDLNPIEHIWDIMSRSIHQHHVAPQTVQELADALVQVLSPHLTQTSENDIASSLVVGTGTLPDRQNGDDPTASHPSTNNNNNDERLDLDGGILGLRVQKKKKAASLLNGLRLETPDETIVSLDKSSFRSAVWQSHGSASGRMYFRASVKYNGPDHPKDFVLQCFNSECVVCFVRYSTSRRCDMGGPDALRDRKDHTPVSYLQGVGYKEAGHRTISTHQPRTRKDMDTLLKHTPSETALQHLALGGPPYPARGFTLTRH